MIRFVDRQTGEGWTRTYSGEGKDLLPGHAYIIQGPKSDEADLWTPIGGGEEPEPNVIRLTGNFEGTLERFSVAGSGSAVIDWGDGDTEEVTLAPTSVSGNGFMYLEARHQVGHTYADATPKTIIITGDDVTGLWPGYIGVSEIDVTGMPTLEYLDVQGEKLSVLEVSQNPALEYLDCAANNISSLEVTGNSALTFLRCGMNNFSVVDLSGLANLTAVSYDVGTPLSSFNVTGCTALAQIILQGTTIAPDNIVGLSGLGALTDLNVNWNGWSVDDLRALFAALPNRDGLTAGRFSCGWGNPGEDFAGSGIVLEQNPGYAQLTDDDVANANGRGWIIAPPEDLRTIPLDTAREKLR